MGVPKQDIHANQLQGRGELDGCVEDVSSGRTSKSRVGLHRYYSSGSVHHADWSRLILTYLIPCHLLTSHSLPTSNLLDPYPRLRDLFTPLCRCIKAADLAGFDVALAAGEDEFVKRRIYLTLERGRDIALRNLFRKVFIAGGFEPAKEEGASPVRRTRIPVAEFAAAIRLGSDAGNGTLDDDEVECLLANMIYKVNCLSLDHQNSDLHHRVVRIPLCETLG